MKCIISIANTIMFTNYEDIKIELNLSMSLLTVTDGSKSIQIKLKKAIDIPSELLKLDKVVRSCKENNLMPIINITPEEITYASN